MNLFKIGRISVQLTPLPVHVRMRVCGCVCVCACVRAYVRACLTICLHFTVIFAVPVVHNMQLALQ